MDIKQKLIMAGVKNLVEFGYPHCDENNILSDMIYSRFFLSMLKENKGLSAEVDKEIEKLISTIQGASDEKPKKKKSKKT